MRRVLAAGALLLCGALAWPRPQGQLPAAGQPSGEGEIEVFVSATDPALLPRLEVIALHDGDRGFSGAPAPLLGVESGTVRFSGVATDVAYVLRARLPQPDNFTTTLAQSEPIRLDGAEPFARVELRVDTRPEVQSRVHARVVDAAGNPIEGATMNVSADRRSSSLGCLGRGTTGADGELSLAVPAAGAAVAAVFWDCRRLALVDCWLEPGQTTELSFTLPSYSAEGTILTAEGEYLFEHDLMLGRPGAEFSGVGWRGWSTPCEFKTDHSGRFVADWLHEPSFDLAVVMERDERGPLHHYECFSDLKAGPKRVHLQLSAVARIVGRVPGDRGFDVTVRCPHNGYKGGRPLTPRLLSDGRFELRVGPESGPIDLVIRVTDGRKTWIGEVPTTVIRGIVPIPGEVVDLGEIEFLVLPALEGRVLDERGAAIPEAWVSVGYQEHLRSRFAQSDPEGHFRLTDVQSFPGELIVRAPGYLPYSLAYDDPAELGGMSHRLEPAALLRGRVVSSSEGVRARDTLDLAPLDEPETPPERGPRARSSRAVRCEADGSFELHAPPGRWRLYVYPFLASAPIEGPIVELTGGERTDVVVEIP